MWGCLFLGVLLCVGMCALTVVLTPIAFRQLSPEWQDRAARYLPVLRVFLPTEVPGVQALPTLDPARATAAAGFTIDLAGAPIATLAPGVTPSAVLGATPIGMPGIITMTPVTRPTATTAPLPANFYVPRAKRVAQLWNNCGPANLVQAMYVLGVDTRQEDTAAWLKPNTDDANVSPWQMAQYVNEQTGLRALVRTNGSIDLMKRLLYAGAGVILETGLIHKDDGSWLGHYVTLVGWDDLSAYFFGLDTFEENGSDGRGVRENYADLDQRWKHFNRVYLVIYPPEQATHIQDILGTAFDERQNHVEALEKAFLETQYNPNDMYAWFNIGTNLVALGRYEEAAIAYDKARYLGGGLPWRMMWYQFGPFKAYYMAGDYKTVLELANNVINSSKRIFIEEAYYYRGLASAAVGIRAQATSDLERTLQLNPNFAPAQSALAELRSGVIPVPETL